MFERERYNVTNDEELPSISISTNMKPHDLPPLPTDHTLVYQQVHYDLEKWTVFRALPEMMKFDQSIVSFLKGLRNGTLKVPDFINTVNPPSLWAYYLTLP